LHLRSPVGGAFTARCNCCCSSCRPRCGHPHDSPARCARGCAISALRAPTATTKMVGPGGFAPLTDLLVLRRLGYGQVGGTVPDKMGARAGLTRCARASGPRLRRAHLRYAPSHPRPSPYEGAALTAAPPSVSEKWWVASVMLRVLPGKSRRHHFNACDPFVRRSRSRDSVLSAHSSEPLPCPSNRRHYRRNLICVAPTLWC